MSFYIGDEVLYQGERYTISIAKPVEPYQYKLVRTTAEGAEVVWALESELEHIKSYTCPRDDTQLVRGSRTKR